MPTSLYNFQYVPLTGRLPGKSFVSQTEQAINGLAQYVYENSTNYEAVKAIAQKAEEDSSSALEYSEEALDKAQTALETVGRAYIKTTSAVDLNDYFDSELLVILSTASTNLPASISGYLTVMSSDTHDYCMQVYIGIDGSVYKRTATISNNTPTFGAWSETPITLSSLQTILANYTSVDASNIGVNAQTDNSVAWGNAIGGGEIAEDEKRLITGGTVYPLSQNVAQNTSNIATNTADIVQNTGGISANSKRITNIEKLLQGNLYDYQTDSSSAYTKTVPSGAMPYAGLEQIGGKTVVMNQQKPNGNFVDTTTWGFSYNTQNLSVSDNVATITITTVPTTRFSCFAGSGTVVTTGHKALILADVMPTASGGITAVGLTNSTPTATQNIDIGGGWYRYTRFATIGSGGHTIEIYIGTSDSYDDVQIGEVMKVKNVMVIDLTLLYGAGNEPTTVDQFKADYPADYYAFNAGELLSAGVTSIFSEGQNLVNPVNFTTNGVSYSDGVITVDTGGGNYRDIYTGTVYDGSKIPVAYIPKLPFLMPGTYTVACDSMTGNSPRLQTQLVDAGGKVTSPAGTSATSFHIEITAPTRVTIRYRYSGTITNLRLTKTSSAVPYRPYFSETYPIPTAIRNLEGYGWSAGTAYNYVDFERKVFVQKVAQIVCDGNTETWTATSTVAGGTYRYTLVLTNNAAFDGVATNIQNVVCNMYNTVTALQQYNSEIGIAGNTTTSIYVRDATYTTNDIAAWKSHLATLSQQGNPLIIQYELATPVETDISAYLTDDNLISVESGGTLTFPNSNGTDYRLPVPSEETYMIDLQSAL